MTAVTATVERVDNSDLSPQVKLYPSTRFMGSKEKLLQPLWSAIHDFEACSVLDLCSGTGVVSYMFKAQGLEVTSNDYMSMCWTFANALVANNNIRLSDAEIAMITTPASDCDDFIQRNYRGLYFSDEDNSFLDSARANVLNLPSPEKKSLAMAALARACLKRRPRGIFTYVGMRYDDGRRDLQMSIKEHFCEAADVINTAVFDNGRSNAALNQNIDSDAPNCEIDLVYLDPPYYSPLSDNEYVRRYHFVEGLTRNWEGVDIQWETKTKKIRNYPTAFKSHEGTRKAFDNLFERYRESVLAVSYSSNSLPNKEEIMGFLKRHKKNVRVIEINHKYCFGTHGHKVGNNKNDVLEFIFLGY